MLGLGRTPEKGNGTLELAFASVDFDESVRELNANIHALERRVRSAELITLGVVALVVYLVVMKGR